MNEPKKLYRSRNNRMISGVCGGLAEFANIDPTLVRIGFVVGSILGFGSFVVIYLIMMIIVPEAPQA